MAILKNFTEYVAWLTTVFDKDPLLLLKQYESNEAPGDNELIVLSASPKDLERMLGEMVFVSKPDSEISQRTDEKGMPWTSESVSYSSRVYILEGGLTYVQAITMEQPRTVGITQSKDGIGFLEQGRRIGEMTINTALTLHPYNQGTKKSIQSDQFSAMKAVYERDAQRRIGNRTVEELLRDNYSIFDDFRIFADEFIGIMEFLSRQDFQAAFQHAKAPYLIAANNVHLE